MSGDMWRPPTNRLMRTLDRSFFQRNIPLKAVRVFEPKDISKCRSALSKSKDVLNQPRIQNTRPVPDVELAKAGQKCILLRPELSSEDGSPWPHSKTVDELVKQELVSIIPYNLHLDYSYWSCPDILEAILPEEHLDEIPSGFNQAGHVLHLNLRDEYLQYKHLIAELLLDKNPACRTVINKINNVGSSSEFRTFAYEVLLGPDDLNVKTHEQSCEFRFDYSKVYWNSKLQSEHTRIVDLFRQGEAVCDLMAGVGPFAIPAGKKKVFVWANDLNPDSHKYLQQNIEVNHVGNFVRSFNEDGRLFVPRAVQALANEDSKVELPAKKSRSADPALPSPLPKIVPQPKTFQHFVLNLPASALSFLPSFIGIYGRPEVRVLLPPQADFEMPLIHVHCFNTKSQDSVEEGKKICGEIGGLIGFGMRVGILDRDGGEEEEGKVEVIEVRDVAPNKRMFCAMFRLPREVAFREV